jgi:hypothetical protein
MSRDVLKRLADVTLAAVRCRGDAWPRALLSETLIPDAWMGLVLKTDGRRHFVPAGEAPRVERDDALVLVRNRALTIAVQLDHVPTADAHLVNARLELLARWPARDDDLAALHETLLTGEELTLADIVEAFRRAGTPAAVQRFCAVRPAATLVTDDLRAPLLEHLRSELQRFLFSAGLVLERLGQVEFASPSLAEANALQRDAARRVSELKTRGMVEQAALAATQRRLDDLSTILTKLKTAAAADGSLRWRELLPTLTPGERGRLLESLWRLTPDRTMAQALVVVAGREVAWLDPRQPAELVRRVTLADDLGGLRSVNYDARNGTLLVGAARGVWQLHAVDGTVIAHFAVPNMPPPPTGFNAAVADDERLYATHSLLGAWSWRLADASDATPLLTPTGGVPKTIRAATLAAPGRVLVAADNRVHAYDGNGRRVWESGPADSAIHCLAVLDELAFAGTAAGTLLRASTGQDGQWLVVHRGLGSIESVQARRWDDLTELVIPAGPQGVCGVYAEEGLVARLLPTAQAARRAWASDDVLVALNEQRDRLTVLNSAMPARAGVEVPVARLLGRAVQDADLVTTVVASEAQPSSLP